VSLVEFFTGPWHLPFMQRAFAVAVIITGLVCGVVGVYVVLRGMAFIGEAVSHSAFPGVALAYAVQGNLLLGGALAGLTTSLPIALVSQNRRLKEDTVSWAARSPDSPPRCRSRWCRRTAG
jgi:manganese/iron transport system permease protein